MSDHDDDLHGTNIARFNPGDTVYVAHLDLDLDDIQACVKTGKVISLDPNLEVISPGAYDVDYGDDESVEWPEDCFATELEANEALRGRLFRVRNILAMETAQLLFRRNDLIQMAQREGGPS